MGNSQKLETDTDTILWLDQNVYNEENKSTYVKYLPKLKNFNFVLFTSVDELINYIKDNLKFFEFKVFYVVVSGRLAENFFTEYVKIAEKYNIIADTIVYCLRQKYHETKPYFNDPFLNAGGITIHFENVVDYILKEQSYWENIGKTDKAKNQENADKNNPKNEPFGDVFTFIDTSKEYELALPILISKHINSSLIEEDGITKFQNLLIKRYSTCYKTKALKLIKPSGIKDMKIPLHILTKFLIQFYTCEKKDENTGQNFYSDLNKDLSNDKFDEYHPFICLIYDCLNKGYVQSYKKILYRGAQISEKKYLNLVAGFKNKENETIKPIYYAKYFMSFSKDENVAYYFLERGELKEKCTRVLFILNECKNENFFVTNIDIESNSSIKIEKEVLILPLTSFEIVNITEEKTNGGINYVKIYLKYLDEYKDKIENKIKDILNEPQKSKHIGNFFKQSMNSELGKIFLKLYDKKKKLESIYSKILKMSPDNDVFINYYIEQTASHLINKFKLKEQSAAHVDDEFENFKNKIKCKGSENKEVCINERKLEFIKRFEKVLPNVDNFDNGCSIGFCIGTFLANYDSFIKAPTKGKVYSLASLALACGPHVMKLIPKLKLILEQKIISDCFIDYELMLDGLNILWAFCVEFYNIIKYISEYKCNLKFASKLIAKRLINLGIAVSFSYIGNIVSKASIYGFTIVTGISLGPLVTVTLGTIGMGAFGYFGDKIGKVLAEKIFGKDEFKLMSANLYYHYIPEKYRTKGNNPHLQWNKDFLNDKIKSYIIECIVNETEIQMRIMNIPIDVFELPECLGDYMNNNVTSEDTDYSSEEENNEIHKIYKIIKNNKFIGDLIIPYKGIEDNAYKVDFIIYRMKKKCISVKEWEDFRKGEIEENIIQDCYTLSVF